PILGNDIPGLKYTIERTNSGKCVDMFDTESIINGIRHIMDNYEEYRCNLGKLLLLSDPIKEIEKIINEND
ncbi:MAG TPA: hypothetical protein GX708_00965, partial [Gallicola sp.]|nr:hypothetical protein [Gallicola sp.]